MQVAAPPGSRSGPGRVRPPREAARSRTAQGGRSPSGSNTNTKWPSPRNRSSNPSMVRVSTMPPPMESPVSTTCFPERPARWKAMALGWSVSGMGAKTNSVDTPAFRASSAGVEQPRIVRKQAQGAGDHGAVLGHEGRRCRQRTPGGPAAPGCRPVPRPAAAGPEPPCGTGRPCGSWTRAA